MQPTVHNRTAAAGDVFFDKGKKAAAAAAAMPGRAHAIACHIMVNRNVAAAANKTRNSKPTPTASKRQNKKQFSVPFLIFGFVSLQMTTF